MDHSERLSLSLRDRNNSQEGKGVGQGLSGVLLSEIHPEDATQAGLKDGDPIRVISPRGEVETICRISEALPKGIAYFATTFFPVFINNLLVSSQHPESHNLEYKMIVGRVEKR